METDLRENVCLFELKNVLQTRNCTVLHSLIKVTDESLNPEFSKVFKSKVKHKFFPRALHECIRRCRVIAPLILDSAVCWGEWINFTPQSFCSRGKNVIRCNLKRSKCEMV
jgi:hypothetical protein